MERLMSASTSSFVAGGGAVRALRAQAPPGASRRASTLLVQAKKRWETQPTNEKTGKAIAVKMHVKQGDKVKVISGGDKGTVSEILEVFRKTGMVKVKDVNVKTKHVKPRQEGESGQIVKIEAPIHHSQVQPVTADGQVSRVGKLVNAEGKKVRVLVKTGEVMPEIPYAKRTTSA